MELYFPRIQVKTKKKRSSPKMEHNSSGNLRSHAHHSQIIGGDKDADQLKLLGGIQSNDWGDIFSPSPLGFGTPASLKQIFQQ